MVIVKKTNDFMINPQFPNTNFTDFKDSEVYVVDELTEEGKEVFGVLSSNGKNFKAEISNGKLEVTAVEIVAEKEKVSMPTYEEVEKAKREIETIELLTLLGVI